MTLSALDEHSATIACQNFGSGWSVNRIQCKALVCNKNGTSWTSNCNDCTTWRMIVWQDGGCETDSKCQQYSVSTVAGKYYGGHSPCAWGDNYRDCGVWGRTGNTSLIIYRYLTYLSIKVSYLILSYYIFAMYFFSFS